MNFFDQTNRILDIGNAMRMARFIAIASLAIGAIGVAVFAIIKYL